MKAWDHARGQNSTRPEAWNSGWIAWFPTRQGSSQTPSAATASPRRHSNGGLIAWSDMAGALRLRLGDYRVLFTLKEGVMRIFGVRHRSGAYR
jgi:hypothetical protein